MDELKKQVGRAHSRLTFQRFGQALVWTLFAGFVIALIATAIPKIWHLAVDIQTWTWSWLGGTAAAGLLLAGIYTLITRGDRLDAAMEIDRRFGLKERVSSTLALTEEELETDAGQALLDDATRRVAQVEVSEEFQGRPKWWSLLPLAPAAAVFLIAVLIPDAAPQKSATAATTIEDKQRVERTAENLKKKLAARKKKAEAQGLEEASDVFSKLEKGAEDLKKLENADRKKALVKLNNLAEEIKQHRDKIGSPDSLRKQFNQLKDLKSGPADRMGDALRKGDLNKALSEIQKLNDKIKAGDLSKQDQKKLAEQLQQMADKLNQMTQAREMAKQELEKQVKQALAAGDRERAGQLQNKLDKMNKQNAQMAKLDKLAQKMSQASQAMKEGKSGEASKEMNAIAAQLSEMEGEMSEMAMLDAALAELEASKEAMNCNSCKGAGCAECMGSSAGRIPGTGQGMGQGQGQGDRPEAATAEQFYESKVKAKVGKGKAVITGVASGPNRTGPALEEYKEAIQTATIDDEDPLTGARIPKEPSSTGNGVLQQVARRRIILCPWLATE